MKLCFFCTEVIQNNNFDIGFLVVGLSAGGFATFVLPRLYRAIKNKWRARKDGKSQ